MTVIDLTEAQVRGVHIGSIAAAVVLVVVALLLLGGAGDATGRLVVILVLLVLLAVQALLFLQDQRTIVHAGPGEGPGWEPPAEEPAAAAPAEAAKMVIRCKQCSEVFPVEDTGARPLVAVCPHCGKSGTIKVRTDAKGQ